MYKKKKTELKILLKMNIKADIYSKRQKQKTGKTLTLAVSTDNSLSHLLNSC